MPRFRTPSNSLTVAKNMGFEIVPMGDRTLYTSGGRLLIPIVDERAPEEIINGFIDTMLKDHLEGKSFRFFRRLAFKRHVKAERIASPDCPEGGFFFTFPSWSEIMELFHNHCREQFAIYG